MTCYLPLTTFSVSKHVRLHALCFDANHFESVPLEAEGNRVTDNGSGAQRRSDVIGLVRCWIYSGGRATILMFEKEACGDIPITCCIEDEEFADWLSLIVRSLWTRKALPHILIVLLTFFYCVLTIPFTF